MLELGCLDGKFHFHFLVCSQLFIPLSDVRMPGWAVAVNERSIQLLHMVTSLHAGAHTDLLIGMVMFLFGRLGRCIPPLDDAFSHFCRFQIENMPGKYLQLVALFAKSSSFETIPTI